MAAGDLKNVFKISRKTFFNPTGWIDYQYLSTQTKSVWGVLKNQFTPAKPLREESFEQAMKRLRLSEADIQSEIKNYHLYALLFALFGILVFLYAFFLLFTGVYLGWLLGISVAALIFAQAFKYDFWAFQLKRRKLGSTFAEWKQHILGETENSS